MGEAVGIGGVVVVVVVAVVSHYGKSMVSSFEWKGKMN